MESRRARTPAPKPCISCTVRMPREAPAHPPSLRPGALPAEGSCFLRRPAAPFSAPAGLDRAAGSQKPKPDTSPRAPEMRSPFSGEGTSPGARSSALPREPDRSLRPRAPPVKGNLAALSPRGQEGWRGGWRGGHGGRRKPEAWPLAPALASRGTVSGIPDPSGPGDEGPTPARLAPAAPAGRARAPPRLPAARPRPPGGVSLDPAPREPGAASPPQTSSKDGQAAGAAGGGEWGERDSRALFCPRRG